jgi:Uma2 family endonuclease
MVSVPKFTSADLEALSDDGKRYEIIEGELYVSRQPGYEHQYICGRLFRFIDEWNDRTALGVVLTAPGVIFAEDDDVAPDVVWMTRERLEGNVDKAGHLHAAPELVVEVLSQGASNEQRDREVKLKLYSRRGVLEYWIVDRVAQQLDIYRRVEAKLELAASLDSQNTLESPLLPGFSCRVGLLFYQPSQSHSSCAT